MGILKKFSSYFQSCKKDSSIDGFSSIENTLSSSIEYDDQQLNEWNQMFNDNFLGTNYSEESKFDLLSHKTDLLRDKCWGMEGTSSSSTKYDNRQLNDCTHMFNDFFLETNYLREHTFDSMEVGNLTQTRKELDNQLLVHDFNYLSCHDHAEEKVPISDETYTMEIDNDNDTLLRNLKQKQAFEEDGSSSFPQLKLYYCAICMEDKPIEKMFESRKCSHSFCEDCVGSYLAAKIQENIAKVKCPDPKCNSILEPYDCISVIPKDVFERWENALVEKLVLASQKFYCPFSDCSAMLVNDGKEIVTDSECPYCHRLFCVQCKVPWHVGVDCRQFQNLKPNERSREDLMTMELAKNKRWKRCPKCNFLVEKIDGCIHIKCRCGHQFCYRCGSTWKNNSHYCATSDGNMSDRSTEVYSLANLDHIRPYLGHIRLDWTTSDTKKSLKPANKFNFRVLWKRGGNRSGRPTGVYAYDYPY